MAQYMKKPIVVDAWPVPEVIETILSPYRMTDVLQEAEDKGSLSLHCTGGGEAYYSLHVKTLGGVITAKPTDKLVRGPKGEFYLCDSKLFRAMYDPIN